MLKVIRSLLKMSEASPIGLTDSEAVAYGEQIERHVNSLAYLRHQYYSES